MNLHPLISTTPNEEKPIYAKCVSVVAASTCKRKNTWRLRQRTKSTTTSGIAMTGNIAAEN